MRNSGVLQEPLVPNKGDSNSHAVNFEPCDANGGSRGNETHNARDENAQFDKNI